MKKLILLFAALLALSGCASTSPVAGALYADVKGPVTATQIRQGKVEGRSCATSYLGLIALGDASVQTAAQAAGITRVTSVDSHTNNILGIITEYCTVVYGHAGKGAKKKAAEM